MSHSVNVGSPYVLDEIAFATGTPQERGFYNSGAVRITGRPPDGANVMLRRTTRTV